MLFLLFLFVFAVGHAGHASLIYPISIFFREVDSTYAARESSSAAASRFYSSKVLAVLFFEVALNNLHHLI